MEVLGARIFPAVAEISVLQRKQPGIACDIVLITWLRGGAVLEAITDDSLGQVLTSLFLADFFGAGLEQIQFLLHRIEIACHQVLSQLLLDALANARSNSAQRQVLLLGSVVEGLGERGVG